MPSRAVERIFLSEPTPPVRLVSRWLLEVAPVSAMPCIDLSEVCVCVPTSRGARLLLAYLVREASVAGESLLPPRILTPGALADVLTTSRFRAATPMERVLAWARALGTLDPEARGQFSPDGADVLRPASSIAASHQALTADLTTFAELEQHGSPLPDVARRVDALARAERSYESILAAAECSDLSLARARSSPEGGVTRLPFSHIVLAGVTDLTHGARRVLSQVSLPLTCLILAPHDDTDLFDELGAVVPDRWKIRPLDLSTAVLRVVDGPDELGDATLEAMSELPTGTPASHVVVALGDESFAPRLIRRAAKCGVEIRSPQREPLSRTPAAALLRAVRDLHTEPTFRAWGTLLRHPWIERQLHLKITEAVPRDNAPRAEQWLAELDEYVLEHLPDRLTIPLMHGSTSPLLTSVLEATTDLLGPLAPDLEAAEAPGPRGKAQPLSMWADAIGRLLTYLASSPGDSTLAPLVETLEALASLHPKLDLEVKAESALDLASESIATLGVPAEDTPGSVESLGWLELGFDDSDFAIVAGFNESLIPAADRLDPVLPRGTIRTLASDREARRVARDQYLLSHMARTRKRLVLLSSRRGEDGEPLLPSRFLARAPAEVVLDRATLWVADSGRTNVEFARPPAGEAAAGSIFRRMPVVESQPPEDWPVTAFRDYLRSPYLFYLRHVVRLEEFERPTPEFRPAAFGSLLHDSLKSLFDAGLTHSSEDRIRSFLHEDYMDRVMRLCGMDLPAPLWLQSRQALGRLDAFAAWQHRRTQEGWRQIAAEWQPEGQTVAFSRGGQEARLKGRIDRIDAHDSLGVALIDYKSFDKERSPSQTHRPQADWRDLQLPLYRHLARDLVTKLTGSPASPAMAYLALSSNGKASLLRADWSDADLESADDTAARVIQLVREGRFQIEGDDPPTTGVFGALVGLDFLGGDLDDPEDEAPEFGDTEGGDDE